MMTKPPHISIHNYPRITAFSCQPHEARIFGHYARQYGIELALTDQPPSLENTSLMTGSLSVSVSHAALLTAPVIDSLHRSGIRYISSRSVGVDHINIEYAARKGILVGNVSYSPDSVADYAIMLMLMSLRRVKPVLQRFETQDFRLPARCGNDLNCLTVGVVGTGRIGRAVISRLAGFGCSILGYDKQPDPALKSLINYVDLDSLLSQSDIVTLHLPADLLTHWLINRESLAIMKAGAILVNTGRGSLIDTWALAEAIEEERLGGAALDVIENEFGLYYEDWQDRPLPNPALVRLKPLPNVILTPHTAFYTSQALESMVEESIKNCLEFALGHNITGKAAGAAYCL